MKRMTKKEAWTRVCELVRRLAIEGYIVQIANILDYSRGRS